MRRYLSLFGSVIVLAAAATFVAGPAAAEDATITSPDGTVLAATLSVPPGAPPAGGWPALVFLHGLGGSRAQGMAIAESMGVVGNRYVVLALDARGHGTSGGTVGLDGPNEVADVRAAYQWLNDRPDVADGKIGVFGISYGGGATWNSLVAGVPWAVAETCITFTDLESALYPQNLAKSGVIAGFLASLDQTRIDPALVAARDAAFAGNTAAVTAFSAPRSSFKGLGAIKTPMYLMQGRRDFAFGLDQALPAWSALTGPKKLWLGNIGHVASSFPGPDTGAMLADGKKWFDRYLAGDANGVEGPNRVTIAAEGSARVVASPGLPLTRIEKGSSAQVQELASPDARADYTIGAAATKLEVFGSPVVKVTATATGGWSRLVAVLRAVTPRGATTVSIGGVPTHAGKATYTIRLASQATVVAKGAKLVLTLATSSSIATGTTGLAYLNLPMPAAAKLSVSGVTSAIPVLLKPI